MVLTSNITILFSNSSFKTFGSFQPFLVPYLFILVFSSNFTYRQIWRCWFQIRQCCFKLQPKNSHIPYLKSALLNLVYLQNLIKKLKCLAFVQEIPDLGIFLAEMWKQYCPIRNQHPHICLIAKFDRKTKIRKFGIKNPLFGYFWPKMLYLGMFRREFLKCYCHIWNQHPQVLRQILQLDKFEGADFKYDNIVSNSSQKKQNNIFLSPNLHVFVFFAKFFK